MVKQFPMDYMHVVLLGIMRMLLKAWSKEKKKPYSISSKKLRYLNTRLITTRNDVPYEFNRKPRSIQELDRWKATELRMFLLYTGPIVLKGLLDTERYNHFLSLSFGINMLLQNKMEYISEAEVLLLDFVEKIQILYNESFLSYNVHCLTHLATDCRNFGSLNKFSAFKYENYLQELKRKLKKSSQFASQTYKRSVEKSNLEKINTKGTENVVLGNLKDGSYTSIQITSNKQATKYFSLQHPNNYYFSNNKIFKIKYIKQVQQDYIVYGYPLKIVKSLTPSTDISVNLIFNANNIEFEELQSEHNILDIRKVFKMKLSNELYFAPLIH